MDGNDGKMKGTFVEIQRHSPVKISTRSGSRTHISERVPRADILHLTFTAEQICAKFAYAYIILKCMHSHTLVYTVYRFCMFTIHIMSLFILKIYCTVKCSRLILQYTHLCVHIINQNFEAPFCYPIMPPDRPLML